MLEQGQLHQAKAVFLEGIQFEEKWAHESGTPGRKLLAAAPIHVSLAQLHYEWNEFDEAEAHLVDANRLLAVVGPVNQSEGLVALARLRLAQDNQAAVPALLTQLETLQETATNQFTRQRLAIAIAETAVALYQQAPTPALRLTLEQSLPALDDEPTAVLAQARVLLTLSRAVRSTAVAGNIGGTDGGRRPFPPPPFSPHPTLFGTATIRQNRQEHYPIYSKP